MLPVVWVVTDSGSSDGSFNIAEHLFRGHEWIHVIHQRVFHGQGYADENMSAAINEGYECAKKLCADRHVDYSYVGKQMPLRFFSRTTLKLCIKKWKKIRNSLSPAG